MSKLLLSLLLFTTTVINANASRLSIVSDLDDTLKITNSGDLSEAVWYALFSTAAYDGMPQLMQDMEAYTNELYIVSASPSVLDKNIKRFLKVNDITYRKFYTRELEDMGDKFNYKYSTIQKIATKNSDKFILIGDNTELDQDVYLKLKADFPQRYDNIYVHKVQKNEIKNGVIGYFTAFELAAHEYKANRKTLNEVMIYATNLLDARSLEGYFPDFAYCPTTTKEFSPLNVLELSAIEKDVQDKIIEYCSNRDID